MKASKFGTYIVLLSVFAVLFASYSMALPWFRTSTEGGTNVSTYYLDYYTSGRPPSWTYFGDYEYYTGVGDVMEKVVPALVVCLLLLLVFIAATLGDHRLESVLIGALAAAILLVVAIYFALRISHAAGIENGGLSGSAVDDAGQTIEWGPLDGWDYVVVAGGLQALATAIRTIVVWKDLPA